MKWNIANDRPIYLQLTELLTQGIAAGEYPPGSRLPSVRDLAAEAGVNPNTMQRALSDLEREGLVITNRTAGRNVTEDTQLIQKVRENLAVSHIEAFLAGMQTLGFTAEDAAALLSKHAKEETK